MFHVRSKDLGGNIFYWTNYIVRRDFRRTFGHKILFLGCGEEADTAIAPLQHYQNIFPSRGPPCYIGINWKLAFFQNHGFVSLTKRCFPSPNSSTITGCFTFKTQTKSSYETRGRGKAKAIVFAENLERAECICYVLLCYLRYSKYCLDKGLAKNNSVCSGSSCLHPSFPRYLTT